MLTPVIPPAVEADGIKFGGPAESSMDGMKTLGSEVAADDEDPLIARLEVAV